MIVYVENKIYNLDLTQRILKKYGSDKKENNILKIDNYKNIFDKKLSGKIEKSLIIASVNNSIQKAPALYGHPGGGYFFKNSLNCVYNCSYCYLKGAFKNDQNVIFVNYDQIKNQIIEELSKSKNNINRFYSSDYSDNLAIDNITEFTTNFIPFFDILENAKMEIRTKSANIGNLLNINPSKNTEIAFSLNPQEIISNYEHKTISLDKRIDSINKLLDNGWQVGIRFIPLLEYDNYKTIYSNFLDYIITRIDFSKIYSVFVGGLLYTHEDFNKIVKKEPYLDLLYKLEKKQDGFYRENREVRDFFYKLFQDKLENKKCNICLDN